MKLSTGFLLAHLVVLGLCLAPACTRETEFYCCTDPGVCAEIVSCPDRYPDRPICDMGGNIGEMPRLCQADPQQPDAGVECSVSLPCTEADLSACLGGICAVCQLDEQCAEIPGAPHCNAGVGCVACTTDLHCTAAAPVCEPTNSTCRGCLTHAECGDGLCQDDGACVPAGDILHVDPARDGVDCSLATPCKTIAEAVALVDGSRKWIKLTTATYQESLSVAGKQLILVGPGSSIEPALNNTPSVLVSGASNLRLEGVKLSNAGGVGSGDGLRCAGGAGVVPVVGLRGVTIDSNAAQGLDALECDVTIERSTITSNAGGGLSIRDSEFVLLNNVVAKNGAGSSLFGGVSFSGGSGRFEFNTIAANVAASAVGGVQCNFGAAQAFKNSIVAGNTPAAPGQVSGNCSWTFSDVFQAVSVPGEGNLNVDPMFVDPGAGDWHLAPTSPCRNVAEHPPSVDVDIDGHRRPSGDRADMGADETQP